MVQKSERLLHAVMGILMVYFAVYFGDLIHAVITTTAYGIIAVGVGFISLVLGVVGLVLLVVFFGERDRSMERASIDCAAYLILGPALIGYGYGVMSSPITEFGFVPWKWITPTSVFLLCALLPAIFTIHSLLCEKSAPAE